MSLVLIFFFPAGRLCCAANLILPLVSRWEVKKLTYFPQNFLGFCCFKCQVWSLVRCSLSIFFGTAGGGPRRSNDGFVLERIPFTLSECENVKFCKRNISNKWIIFMVSFHAVLVLNFVSANYCNFFLFLVSLGQVYFVLVLTSTNHKARNRYPGYGSDWRISV